MSSSTSCDPKVKKTYRIGELNTNKKHFYIAMHLNSSYFPAILTRSSVVIDGKKDSKVETGSPSWSTCVVRSLHSNLHTFLL